MNADSYIMALKQADDRWRLRLGVVLDGESRPIEMHNVADLQGGVERLMDVCETLTTLEQLTSDRDLLPLLSRVGIDGLVSQATRAGVGWGIVMFRANARGALWFACLGHEAQLDRNEWAAASAGEDEAHALGGLRVEATCSAIEWRRDMLHTVNTRDENGDLVCNSSKIRRNQNRTHNSVLQHERNIAWRESEWPALWAEALKRATVAKNSAK